MIISTFATCHIYEPSHSPPLQASIPVNYNKHYNPFPPRSPLYTITTATTVTSIIRTSCQQLQYPVTGNPPTTPPSTSLQSHQLLPQAWIIQMTRGNSYPPAQARFPRRKPICSPRCRPTRHLGCRLCWPSMCHHCVSQIPTGCREPAPKFQRASSRFRRRVCRRSASSKALPASRCSDRLKSFLPQDLCPPHPQGQGA
jgi:hypothetical protein